MRYDPSKTTWLNPAIEYIFDTEIIEYDIRDAGFSLIRQFGLLPSDKITELAKLGKGIERHIAVGKLQGADPVFSKALNDKFADMRRVFISKNNISDNDIVSVKKDALFIIGNCEHLKFGQVAFAEKNKYSSYIRFTEAGNTEIYYSEDQIDIKGIGDSGVNRHRLYLLDKIKDVIRMLELKDPKVKRYLINFIMEYKSRDLEDEYYIRFDRKSSDMDPLFNYQKIIIPLVQIIMREIG